MHRLPHLPVIKDLLADFSAFYAQYAAIQPWLRGARIGGVAGAFLAPAECRAALGVSSGERWLHCLHDAAPATCVSHPREVALWFRTLKAVLLCFGRVHSRCCCVGRRGSKPLPSSWSHGTSRHENLKGSKAEQ